MRTLDESSSLLDEKRVTAAVTVHTVEFKSTCVARRSRDYFKTEVSANQCSTKQNIEATVENKPALQHMIKNEG